MSDNIINKIIQNNYKIGEDNIPKVEENTNEDNDGSFNQLLALQLLIQKHTGLKELCKYLYLYFYSYKRKRRYYQKNK
jgi:hypothetical protein